MKKYYLFAAIMGIIIPVAFFVSFIQQSGLDLPAFVSALFVNGAAGGFSADLLILSFVFWVSMFQHKKQKGDPAPALFIVLNLCIGHSCALPAYPYRVESIRINQTPSDPL